MSRTAALLLVLVLVALAVVSEAKPLHHRLKHKKLRSAVTEVVAATAPRGWNSYDSYDYHVDETEFLQNVDAVAEYLLPYGYEYVTIDYYWYYDSTKTTVTLDENGRLQPDPVRWPHGLAWVADYVHAKGLKFGIHIMRGIHTAAIKANLPIAGAPQYTTGSIVDSSAVCSWNSNFYGLNVSAPGAQPFYDSITAQYADWGVDFVKYDCVFAGNFRPTDIKGVAVGIQNSGRAIALSLSPGVSATPDVAKQVSAYSNVFRISNDLWDCWAPADSPWMNDGVSVSTQFDALATFASMQGGAGLGGSSWADADMLPIGKALFNWKTNKPFSRNTQLTEDEQYTMLTLWSIARAPLILGGAAKNLTGDSLTLALLTNPDVLALQNSSVPSQQLYHNGTQVVWATQAVTDSAGGFVASVALFNVADEIDQAISVSFAALVAAADDEHVDAPVYTCVALDLWEGQALGTFTNSLTLTVGPHASELVQLTCST